MRASLEFEVPASAALVYVIGLGANLGDPWVTLRAAVAEIEALSKRISGTQGRAVDFLADLEERFIRTRKAYTDYLRIGPCDGRASGVT